MLNILNTSLSSALRLRNEHRQALRGSCTLRQEAARGGIGRED